MSDVVQIAFEDGLAILTINRPDKLNALNREVLETLHKRLDEATEKKVYAAIITGAGKAFVAGADIAEMKDLSPADAQAFAELGHSVGEKLETTAYPVIAAINGFALGGGCEFSLACDFAFASTKARLGQPEVKLGVIPGFGGTQRLLRRVGVAMARELVYTGRMIHADEALRIGLVNAVVEPDALMDHARSVAAEIAQMGPLAIKSCKELFIAGADRNLREANQLEAEAFGRCFLTKDQKEGMSAFVEKRAPNFTGE
ncbi:MAG: enoyl-CoA hydratase-related protein [Myxococcota bacterium]